MTAFLTALNTGRLAVCTEAITIMGIIMAIVITLMGIDLAMGDGEPIKKLVKKVLLIGMFMFLIKGFGPGYSAGGTTINLTNVVLQGFVWVGNTASGNTALGGTSIDIMNDPSLITTLGQSAAHPILDSMGSWNPLNIIPNTIAFWIVRLTYFILALQVFLCRIEFALVTSVGIVFLPFAILDKTAFLAEKFISAVVSFGIKLMVLACIIGMSYPILKQFQLPANPSFDQIINLVCAVGAIAFIAWQAPGVASAVMAGSPSLSTGSAAQGAIAAGMAGAATVGLVAGGVGVAHGAAKLGAGAFGAGLKTTGAHPIQTAKTALSATGPTDAYKKTSELSSALKQDATAKTSGTPKGSSESQSGSTSSGKSPLRTMQQLQVPPESSAGPGANVNLKPGEEEE